MRYWHFSGLNLGYSLFFMIGVLIAAIIGIFLVFDAFKRNSPENERIVDILNVRYAKNEIDDAKYYEVKSILEDGDSDSPAILVLKERYASGNLSSVEFIKMRDVINLRRTV